MEKASFYFYHERYLGILPKISHGQYPYRDDDS
jgi:hypothetical protein